MSNENPSKIQALMENSLQLLRQGKTDFAEVVITTILVYNNGESDAGIKISCGFMLNTKDTLHYMLSGGSGSRTKYKRGHTHDRSARIQRTYSKLGDAL